MRAARIGLLLALIFFSSGCASWQPAPSGALLFSYRVVEGAFSGVPRHEIGTAFFLETPERTITGYRYRGKKPLEILQGGSVESDLLLQALREIGFTSFNYEDEVQTVEKFLRENPTNSTRVMTVDGASFEIKFAMDGKTFSMVRSNPRHDIDFYARHSPKIAKLKAVIDLFAEFTGKEIFNTLN
jgi:hypothetical protein